MERPPYSLSPVTYRMRPGTQLATILNHLQSQLRASAILLGVGLPGLLPFPFSPTTWCQLVLLPFAIEPHQDGNGPVLVRSEGKADVQGEDHPVVTEGKERPGTGGT